MLYLCFSLRWPFYLCLRVGQGHQTHFTPFKNKNHNYRPQTKFAKVMFLQMSVILFTGGVPGQVPPPGQVHPQTRYTPWAGTTPGYIPQGPGTPPLSGACWEIRATSGRYASYWNAFFLGFCICETFIAFYLVKNYG